MSLNYTADGKHYEANEGYVFRSKRTGIISKVLRLRDPKMMDNYEVIPEPVPEETEETEENTNVNN